MGIYINGMEMPKDCDSCPFFDDDADYPICTITMHSRGYNWSPIGQIMSDCPLAPVPPHGRLIDADALIASVSAETCDCNPEHFDLEDKEGYGKWMLHNGINTGITAARVRIKNAPTIIEKEEI